MRTVLDEYDIVTQVPKPGGMGLVYRARRRSGQTIALKIIPLQPTADSAAMVRSARRGAEVQRLLADEDRHVPRVYDFGEKHGVFFIEMEFIEGEDLSTALARLGRIPSREAARIAYEVAAFLDVAHHTTCGGEGHKPAELVHSDLKPANMRIARRTRDIKILDFGIAKAGWHTATTRQFGSLPYMSPERIEGRIDRHADYWALGVALYEMLAGRLPYAPTARARAFDPHELQQMILARRPPPPLPAVVPESLKSVVTCMLHPDPACRYQDAGDLKSDLAAILKGRALPVRRRSALPTDDGDTVVLSTANAAPPQTSEPPASSPWPRRRGVRARWPRLAVQLCAAVVVVLLVDACAIRRASQQFVETLHTGALLDPDGAWARYERLRGWSFVPFMLAPARAPLRDRLVAAADQVLLDFRRDQPSVRAAQWESARRWLERAAALEPSNRSIRARLLCTEGHLARISGERERATRQRTSLLDNAVQRFRQASRLDERTPDPYLGLARIYSSGLIDVDATSGALAEAERRGQPIGRRGYAQLADATRSRADRMRQSAAAVRGLPEEKAHLLAAAADYERALAFYEKAQGFGLVPDNVRAVRARVALIERRLADIGAASEVAADAR